MSAFLIINCNTNMGGAMKQEWVRITHTLFHLRQSYTLNDVFVIQVVLYSRKRAGILQMISIQRRKEDNCGAAAGNSSLTSSGGVPRRACFRPYGQPVSTVMDLPSSRELELEALLRSKDSQLAELTVRILVGHFISYSLGVTPRTRSTPSASISRLSQIPHLPSLCLCRPHLYLCS